MDVVRQDLKRPILDVRSLLLKALSPATWYTCFNLNKETHHKNKIDAELELYGNIVTKGYLHYGYFKDKNIEATEISAADFERAQIAYADKILEVLPPKSNVLDVGCGMGGLLKALKKGDWKATGLTPNKVQIKHISQSLPDISLIEAKFEKIDAQKFHSYFDTVINSESFQYINLDQGLINLKKVLKPDGKWVVTDYFRIGDAFEKSGHHWPLFKEKVDQYGFEIIIEEDITDNILPTLKYLTFLVDKLAIPLVNYAFRKVEYKKPAINYLLNDSFDNIRKKMHANRAIIDPEVFVKDKRYMFLVLKKK